MNNDELEQYLQQLNSGQNISQLQQIPQFSSGLLGELGGNNTSQQQAQELVAKGQQSADMLAQNSEMQNQQAMQASQAVQNRIAQSQQAAAQQAQQQAQQQQKTGQLLGMAAKAFGGTSGGGDSTMQTIGTILNLAKFFI